ncbi:MAG: hypothetical protein KC443_25710, partial [Anaerolineales bacterium]|nr:hypothetical protein [Anaerolineales bacterium]
FAAIRSEFDIPRRDDLSLRDYATLEKVIGFVYEMRPDLESRAAAVSEQAPEPPALPAAAPQGAVQLDVTADPVADKVLQIVADQTGYPTDMLDLDLDLEADLGI